MGSLLDLNTYSQTTVSFTDERNPGPRFNIPEVLDETLTASSGTIDVNWGGLEILEIIRATDAQIELWIDLSGLSTATVNWGYIAPGSVTTSVGNVYKYQYIEDLTTWTGLKGTTITIPSTFQGSFFYDVYIKWVDDEGSQQLNWQVGEFVPVSNFANTFSLTADNSYIRGVEAQFDSEFTILGEDFYTYIDLGPETYSAAFTFDVIGTRPTFATVSLSSVFGLSTNTNYLLGTLASLQASAGSLSCAPTEIPSIGNYSGTRAYTANSIQTPWSTLTINPDLTGTIKVVFTVTDGILYSNSDTDASIFNGTVTLIDADPVVMQSLCRAVQYLPDYNFTSSTSYRVQLYVDNVLLKDSNSQNLNWNGTTATIVDYWNENTSAISVIPYSYQYHDKVDMYLIGAGGGGADYSAGGGGGGGEIVDWTDTSWTFSTMSAASSTLSAGSAGGWGVGSFGVADAGGQGGSTTIDYDGTTYTARGGFGGGDGSNGSGLGQGSNTPGNTTYTGGNFIQNSSNGLEAGGGGAGWTGDGVDAYIVGSAPGVTYPGNGGSGLTLNGTEYGRGGFGYSEDYNPTALQDDALNYGRGGNGGPTNTYGDGVGGALVIRWYR